MCETGLSAFPSPAYPLIPGASFQPYLVYRLTCAEKGEAFPSNDPTSAKLLPNTKRKQTKELLSKMSHPTDEFPFFDYAVEDSEVC